VGSAWFETVAEAQRRARKRLPASVYGALVAGSEQGLTVTDNVSAFSELGFAPHVAGLAARRDLATTVMGQDIALPVLISPTGVQAVHPDGELAVARAAAARGTVMGLSSFASQPVEEVVAASPQTFFQIYWVGTRDQMLRPVERARAAGAAGLILTLDWTFSHARDWGSPAIPERMDLRTVIRLAPEALRRPRWLAGFARTGRPPTLTVPNMAARDEPAPTFFGAFGHILFLCAHGGNREPATRAVARLRGESVDALLWMAGDEPAGARSRRSISSAAARLMLRLNGRRRTPTGDAHAGRTETAIQLALDPDRVRMSRAEAGNRTPIAELMPLLQAAGVRAASRNGVLGDPSGASAAEGAELLAALTADLLAAVAAWRGPGPG
jgi:FMN-dependent dehydrogenase/Creatinine amidohydrolase